MNRIIQEEMETAELRLCVRGLACANLRHTSGYPRRNYEILTGPTKKHT